VAVVRAILELGHSLGLTVVAEGVEEDVARDQLEGMGCDVAQGFLISRPLEAGRFDAWLSARTVSAPGGGVLRAALKVRETWKCVSPRLRLITYRSLLAAGLYVTLRYRTVPALGDIGREIGDFANELVTGATDMLGNLLLSALGFSPDGRHVAFDRLRGREGDRRELHVMPVEGGRSTHLARSPSNDAFLGWSPKGYILFSSDRTGTPGVWQIRMENGSPAGAPELVRPDVWRVTGMNFDAEGRFYYRTTIGSRDVYVAAVDAGTGSITLPSRPLVGTGATGTRGPEWSPDGGRLAHLSERGPSAGPIGGPPTVAVRSLETGETREHPLPPTMQGVETVGWTADGRAVVVRANRYQGEPALVRVDVQTGQMESRHIEDFGPFGILPGTNLVFGRRSVSVDGQAPVGQVILHDLDTGEERVVVELGPTGGTPPGPIHTISASPDGTVLAVALWQPASEVPAPMRIMLHALESDETRELLIHERPIWGTSLAFTPDGRGLYFSDRFDVGEDRSVDWVIRPWLVDIATGEKRELDHLPRMTTVIRPHPDGQRIATVAGQMETELWVMEDIAPVQRR
jgi:dipeptidyl aminopeptidase/acylaminoacyl peptidase